MEMKGLNENKQEEKGKLEHWKFAQGSHKQVHSSEVGLFLVKLTQASNNSPRRQDT